MRSLIALISALTIISVSSLAFARGGGGSRGGSHSSGHTKTYKPQVHVPTYIRHDGKVVQSHTRTAPDKTQKNNWSSKPNVNPNTGKPGTKTPKK